MASLPATTRHLTGGLDRTKAASFIGPLSLYYLAKFQAIEDGAIFHWNWGAFLGGGFWFAYRRAYRAAWGLNALYLFLGCMGETGTVLALILWVLSAALGDYVYYRDITKRIERHDALPDWQRDAFLAANSGAGLSSHFWLLVIATIAATALASPAIDLPGIPGF